MSITDYGGNVFREDDHPPNSEGSRNTKGSFIARPPACAQPVDLRLLDYVDGFDKNLMCPICHCPFVGATKLPCDHTFCRMCVIRALQNQHQAEETCPSCRTVVSNKDFSPVPRFIVHMIDDLMVKCPAHEKGCPKTMRRGDVLYHIDSDCEYCDVDCPEPKCGMPIPRYRHGEECLHEVVPCNDCKEQIMKFGLKDHVENHCYVKEWPCSHCQENVVARNLKIHEEECPDATVPCKGAEAGCAFIDSRVNVQSHQKSCPISRIWPTLSALTSRLDQQEAAMDSLRHRNTLLEKGLDSIKDTLDTTKLPLDSSRPPSNESGSLAEGAVADAPFDSATHHLLSLHETLREEIGRVSGSVTELDARSSLMIMNENLRLKEEMAHLNAVVNSMRMQLQWLMSARLQAQQRLPPGTANSAQLADQAREGDMSSGSNAPIRRLSDSSTKL